MESLEAENAELRRRVTETFQALQGAHTVAEQTKRAAQETVRVAKRAQAVAEADLAHVREELAAAHAANALTSHAAEAQLDMDQGRLGELNAALEAQQLALEAAQRNVARESDRADAAAAAAARRVAELNDARDEIDRLRAALEVHVGHRSGRGGLTTTSTPADTPGDTPRSSWTSSAPAPFNPGSISAVNPGQRPTGSRPPPAPTHPAPSTAAKAAAAAMGRVPASERVRSRYRSRSASPSPAESPAFRKSPTLRGHFAEGVGGDAVDPDPRVPRSPGAGGRPARAAARVSGRSAAAGAASRLERLPLRRGRGWRGKFRSREEGGFGREGRAGPGAGEREGRVGPHPRWSGVVLCRIGRRQSEVAAHYSFNR